ncbi:hypothetical protein HY463_00380 [Candidatus Peregrinibacteria bacterium]|nr:hypothetical protein [Candidatus Peregrinibacteria bacterium]
MYSISVKELRNELPFVRRRLIKGDSFLIIYKSKPIAKLSPVSQIPDYVEAADKEIEKAAIEDFGDDYLSKKEVKYYMSL